MKTECPYADCRKVLEFDDDGEVTYGTAPWDDVCICEKQRRIRCQASIIIDVQPLDDIELTNLGEEIPEGAPLVSPPLEAWPEQFEDERLTWEKYAVFVTSIISPAYATMEHYVRGIGAEIWELVAEFTKAKRDSRPVNPLKVIDEMGDITFFLTAILGEKGRTWEELTGELIDVPPYLATFFRTQAPIDVLPLIPSHAYRDFLNHGTMDRNDLRLVIHLCERVMQKLEGDDYVGPENMWLDVWERNVAKLSTRYPKGQFDATDAANRNLKAEADATGRKTSSDAAPSRKTVLTMADLLDPFGGI